MSDKLSNSCRTICYIVLIHKYYVTDMTAKQCQTSCQTVTEHGSTVLVPINS